MFKSNLHVYRHDNPFSKKKKKMLLTFAHSSPHSHGPVAGLSTVFPLGNIILFVVADCLARWTTMELLRDVNSTHGINYWPPPRSTTYARHHLARTRTYCLILNAIPDLSRCNWRPFVLLSLFYFVFHLRVSCPEQRTNPRFHFHAHTSTAAIV